MSVELRELVLGTAASGVALMADAGVLHALVSVGHWHYQAAAATGFLTGVVVAYALYVQFVFRHHRLASRTSEFAVFAAIGLGGLLINAGVIAVVVEGLQQHYLIAKATAAVATFSFNFGVRRYVLFRPPSATQPSTIRS
jgi:putative flippase GtrA